VLICYIVDYRWLPILHCWSDTVLLQNDEYSVFFILDVGDLIYLCWAWWSTTICGEDTTYIPGIVLQLVILCCCWEEFHWPLWRYPIWNLLIQCYSWYGEVIAIYCYMGSYGVRFFLRLISCDDICDLEEADCWCWVWMIHYSFPNVVVWMIVEEIVVLIPMTIVDTFHIYWVFVNHYLMTGAVVDLFGEFYCYILILVGVIHCLRVTQWLVFPDTFIVFC